MKAFNPNQHQAKKRFGQNFLQDGAIIERIVKSIRPTENESIVEIGPGLGALTKNLLVKSKKISVIELDRDVIPKLKFNCDGLGTLNIYQQDALKTNFSEFAQNGKIRVLGNLPYNISTPIMFHLYQYLNDIQDMHFMLQKEVVQRMVAKPGNKTYGRLSVMTQYACDAQLLFIVPPEAFIPAPKVDSAIVRLVPKKNPIPLKDFNLFSSIVTEAFNQRRKTVRNVWKKRLTNEDFVALEIEPGLRPENLPLESFIQAANYLADNTV
ncbi:16S rRNA (adenine(1518)-N(6)/adenine(1519)-N(6))-dimethyltransferase RsmA [Aliikangiella sp. IMCC44359]|uniref:16S rRNA (adenine(1518)-N(6)/adenine(1519)-N(6))- dimethyltransferase RsmA n=1 Tax=Aliikangiella sp. IMCC44359 TaxID=3459125 RepID=UPI00403A81AE